MFKWIRKILAGDQSATPPDGVSVERDHLGRVTSATATLSAGPGEDDADAPSPVPSKRFSKTLAEAGRRLNDQNIEHIITFC